MSESKTPTPRTDEQLASNHWNTYCLNEREGTEYVPADFARTLELELNEALKWKNEDPRMLREQIKVADNAFNGLTERYNKLEAQLTTAQQDLAKIAKALRTQQQRYHDLSEEVEGLKKDKETLLETCKRVVTQMGIRSEPHIPHYVRRDIEQQLHQAINSVMKGTKE